MAYVFNFNDAREYVQWMSQPRNQWALALECELMINLLKPVPGESILDIGCGAGFGTQSLLGKGLNVTGLDPSPYMLDLCLARVGHRADLYRGYAEDLPFDDNAFNHAIFVVSLEFVNDPVKAIEEACRVAKDKVFLGFLNRFALKGAQRWRTGFSGAEIFKHARLFSVWELKSMVRSVVGPVPVSWRTVCQLPHGNTRMLQSFEASDFVQRCPFGAFAGMVATMMPRFRTRPLALRYMPRNSHPAFQTTAPVCLSTPTPDHSELQRQKQVSEDPERTTRHERGIFI
jgi:SAM-dependent methyltransferase